MTVKILLLEDDPDDAGIAQRALRSLDRAVRVVLVPTAAAALDYLSQVENGDRSSPRLVLADLKLPAGDALVVLDRIKASARLKGLDVVMLTDWADDAHVSQAHDAGADGYVQKPRDYAGYRKAARDIQRYWMYDHEPPPYTDQPVGHERLFIRWR